MLTESEANRVWERMYEADVRSLYFGDLGATFSRRRRILNGVSLVLSSGAAATLAAKAPPWIPLVMMIAAAVLAAYNIAANLEKRISSMARLHCDWSRLSEDLEALWNRWHEAEADAVLREVNKRAHEASELAITDAPYDEGRMKKWAELVHGRYVQVERPRAA